MRTVLALVLILLIAAPVVAQVNDCGQGMPCGPVPWRLPVLPRLSSPTPMPTAQVTGASTPGIPTATAPPLSTLNSVDTAPIQEQVSTLTALMYSTPVGISNWDGSYAEATSEADTLAANAVTFLSYAKGLGMVNFGNTMTPLVWFLLSGFVLTLGLSLTNVMAPIIAVIFGAFRRIVSTIMDFLPL
jgi:hypothetical protein